MLELEGVIELPLSNVVVHHVDVPRVRVKLTLGWGSGRVRAWLGLSSCRNPTPKPKPQKTRMSDKPGVTAR